MALATEKEIRQSYEDPAVAEEYVESRFANELMSLLHDRQVSAVNRVMRDESPRVSLEVAPGPGRITRDVVAHAELVALEHSAAMLAQARQRCGQGISWVQGNGFELPFDECQFDFAYSFRFIRHFHRGDRDRLYTELFRVLRPGGMLVLDAVNARVSGPLREANPENYPIYDKLYRDEAELRDELSAAGFEAVRVDPVQRWFWLQYQAQVLLGPRSRRMSRWIIRAAERLRRGPSLEWVVTARRQERD